MSTTVPTNVPPWHHGRLDRRSASPSAVALLILTVSLGAHVHRPASLVAQQKAESPRWSAPPLKFASSLRVGTAGVTKDGSGRPIDVGARISLERGLDALAKDDSGQPVQIVFLGETHTDETTHRFELAAFEGLCERSGNRVVLSLEMFDRDVQPVLDDYLAGKIDEAAFLEQSRPWNNYRSAYRPLVEAAKRRGLPVIAANFPRGLRRQVMMRGKEGWESVRSTSPLLVPKKLLPHSRFYWKRVDNAIRGHLAMMQLPDDPAKRLLSTQSLWDNTMAESCLDALEKHPGWTVLHVNGGFHSAYHDGTVRQVKLRSPETVVRTVAIVPTGNPATAELRGKPPADIVAFVEARAEDEHEGKWTVVVTRGMKYRLHLPDSKQSAGADRWPLLLWLGDDGLASQDGMAYWKSALGEQVAIAVLEPTYREEAPDLSAGGRWFWPDSFSADVGTALESTERIWGYLLRHYPIDPQRVVLAGHGTGATLVAAAALQTDRMRLHAVAIEPKRYTKLRDLPLPIPELWGDDEPPPRRLTVLSTEPSAPWWQKELKDYAAQSHLVSKLVKLTGDPWQQALLRQETLTTALGLEAKPKQDLTTGRKRFLPLPRTATPRARHWLQVQALRASRAHRTLVAVVPEGTSIDSGEPIELPVTAGQFAAPGRLPRCPGPFGGTTIVVLERGTPEDAVNEWVELEQHDPVAAHSRFHRLRIASSDPMSQRYLPKVLEKLAEKRRRNVLIVPATFAADVAQMQRLKQIAAPSEDEMTLQWMPGLGGQDAWFGP